MRVGVPKEIKNHEYRVGLTPASVAELVAARPRGDGRDRRRQRHRLPDKAYRSSRRARSFPTPPAVFKPADMIVKVKEPQPQEIALLEPRPHPLHLSPPRRRQAAGRGPDEVGRDLHRLRDRHRRQRRAAAAHADERSRRPHVGPGRRALSGKGAGRPRRAARRRAGRRARPRSRSSAAAWSGVNAAQMAVGMRADVTIYDINNDRLRRARHVLPQPDQDRYASNARRSRRR